MLGRTWDSRDTRRERTASPPVSSSQTPQIYWRTDIAGEQKRLKKNIIHHFNFDKLKKFKLAELRKVIFSYRNIRVLHSKNVMEENIKQGC